MKKTRFALFQSVICLMLCFSMLVGTTFAWFTDTVTSNQNVIAAGTLDVELEYWTGSTWAPVTEQTNVFEENTLWEPGHTEVVYLRISNAGNLALNYKFGVNIVDETPSVNQKGDPFKLSQFIRFGAVAGNAVFTEEASAPVTYPSREAARDALTQSWSIAENYTDAEALYPVGNADGKPNEKLVTLVVYMPEDVGNAANYATGAPVPEIKLGLQLVATQQAYESDSFGDTYDEGADFPALKGSNASTTVQTVDGKVSEVATMAGEGIGATVPVGVSLSAGVTELTLSVTEKTSSDANLTLSDDEILRPLDVHIEGVSANNTQPIIISIEKAMMTGLNMGNYKLYHVENGQNMEMTLVASVSELDAHNEFYYDPATGDVTLAMATFSEIAVVADAVAAWEGNFDYSWYTNVLAPVDGEGEADYIIANADQLAAFGAIVGGMANVTYPEGQTRDSFSGKTVKLIADINLGDKDDASENLFYPIGYYNDAKSYTKPTDGTATAANVTSFQGIFDGNGHTIANFYQNTWQMWGNYDGNYYKAAMGLFGYVVNGTVKNLTVDHFSSDGEYTPTGVIAAYAVNSTFENIAITNCNPRVYNTGNGGIVGIGGSDSETSDPENVGLRFNNITIDNTNIITALWGSWDVACGGLVGMFRGPNSVWMTNCHVAAQIDVYNDVCGNYQYYWYRYSGMMIGTNKNMTTDADGYTVPETNKFHAENCTVHFGDWNDYYYCELVANSLASYTHDHQFSRLSEISSLDEIKSGDTWTKTGNFLLIAGDTKTCYHIVKNADGTLKQHLHTDAGEETVNGKTVLKEDNQIVYLPFNQLFTGYGWGVKHIPVYNGDDYAFEGITILDREIANSVEKFKPIIDNNKEYATESIVTIGDLFAAIENAEVDIKSDNVQVSVSPFGATSTAGGTYVANTTEWTEGTLTFSGVGQAVISITDYYFCNTTTVTVNIVGAEKFDTNFVNYNEYLYRVGNADKSTVALGTIFKHSGKGTIHSANVEVTFTTVAGNASGIFTANTSEWKKGTIQFTGTGVVKVTIKDDTSKEFVLNLEVVDATNVTGLSGTISGNVVLLNDCGLSSLIVSGRNTVYGNGFTATYTGDGRYLNNGLKQGVITVSENGMLDNLRVVASIYPYMAFSYSDVQTTAPKEVDGTKTRYYYQLSAISVSGNATVSNCYVYGGRTNIFIGGGNVTIKDTVLECGVAANAQIISSNEYRVTLNNVTTIQKHVKPTVGEDNEKQTYNMLGLGILLGELDKDVEYTSPEIVLLGEFKQYNWASNSDASMIKHDYAGYSQTVIKEALKYDTFKRKINNEDAVNMGIVFLNSTDPNMSNNTGLNYVGPKEISIATLTGQVYSLSKEAPESQVYSDYDNADRTTVNDLYQPQFKYPDNLGGQYIEKTEDGDEFCYREGDTIRVLFPVGTTKTLDLKKLVDIAKYSGQNLNLSVSSEDIEVSDGKTTLSAAGQYTVTYTVTDTLFYDKDGKSYEKSIAYFWNVIIDVALKETAIPNAEFDFDYEVQKIYRSGNSSIVQFIPFLSGLKIYDYDANGNKYLRFDGGDTEKTTDFAKIAKATINNIEESEAKGNHIVTIEFTDGGKLVIDMDVRADSGSGTHTGSIKVRNNVIYVVNNGTTSGKGQTWKIYSYKFVGNNGTEINSGLITFGTAGTDCDIATKPSSSFSTSIKYTVTFDANGGNCVQTLGYATSASTAVTLPVANRSGYTFKGWYTAATGGTRVGGAKDSYTPNANITLYAQWGEPVTITFNANGGNCKVESVVVSGAYTLPEATMAGKDFFGWYKTDGERVGGAGDVITPENNIVLEAHWGNTYSVTYNANGGTCSIENATYTDTALTLPTPTRTGWKFLGWYTAASGGTKIGDAGKTYTPGANVTLYAQWEQMSYTITINKQSNATVTVDKTSAYYGDTISVTVTFSKKYSKSLTVKDASGNTVLSKSDNGTYTFTMPASNVTIEASSSSTCLTPDTLITLADGTQKEIQYVRVGDEVIAWNFYTGAYEVVPVSLLQAHETGDLNVLHLYFEDGTELKILGEHGVYDADLDTFVFVDEFDVETYIGHNFVKQDGDEFTTVRLVGYEVTTEPTTAYTILSYAHYNVLAEGMFTVTPAHVGDNFFNPFDIGEDLKYDEAAVKADIEKYGLYTYEDFEHVLTYEQFIALKIDHFKVSVGKGYITYDGLIYLIENFVNNEDFNIN